MREDEDPSDFFNRLDACLNELKSASVEPIPDTRQLNYLILCLPFRATEILLRRLTFRVRKKKTVEYLKAQLLILYKRRLSDAVENVEEEATVFSRIFVESERDQNMSPLRKIWTLMERLSNRGGKGAKS